MARADILRARARRRAMPWRRPLPRRRGRVPRSATLDDNFKILTRDHQRRRPGQVGLVQQRGEVALQRRSGFRGQGRERLVHAAAIEDVAPTWSDAAEVLGREVLGGCILGVLGWLLIHHLLPRSADYATGPLVSLPAVAGLYVTALHLHVSGPSTTVVAGLLAGNLALYKLNAGVLVPLRTFWKGLDAVLNALLFVFVGLHVVLINPLAGVVTGVPGSIAIMAVLTGRAVAVGLTVSGLDAMGAIRADRWGLTKL